ncbi:uncharacterized protein LOC142357631 [Convolutriloba macropyga]|uniref:uncharacterized protein LOC142357631 n=1 Tax=Convolutriloba macropyga TaxID=536237 RepID=UPI003F51F6DA
MNILLGIKINSSVYIITSSDEGLEQSTAIRSLLERREKEYRRLVAEGKNVPRSTVLDIVGEDSVDQFDGVGTTSAENRRIRILIRFGNICSRIADEYRARLTILEEKKRKRQFRDNVASTKKYASLLEAVKALGFHPVGESDEDAWVQVQNCRYLRGHEPKNMRMPKQGMLTEFVFGDAEIPSDDEQ